MYVHNLDPVIFSFHVPFTQASLSIHWYGLVYFLGFIALYIAFRKLLKMPARQVDSLVIWLVLGLLVGARTFFFVFYRPDLFTPLQFIKIMDGGMSFHGGLLGLLLAGYVWARINNYPFWKLADVGALVAAFFLSLGRLANFVNAEIIGTRFDGPWCVDFSQSNPYYQGCRHPVQIYAAFKDLFIGVVLVLLWRAKRFKDGFIFWSFVLLYSVLRFLVNFLRDEPVLFWWVKTGHVLTFVLFIIASYVLWARHRGDVTKLFKRGRGGSR